MSGQPFLFSPRAGLGPVGTPIYVTPALPRYPSELEDVRRRVRHGLADVIAWCGDDVGPKPGEPIHAVAHPDAVFVSQELFDRLREEARRP